MQGWVGMGARVGGEVQGWVGGHGAQVASAAVLGTRGTRLGTELNMQTPTAGRSNDRYLDTAGATHACASEVGSLMATNNRTWPRGLVHRLLQLLLQHLGARLLRREGAGAEVVAALS